MAEQEFPPVEESLAAVADKLGGLLRQLVYPEGVTLQKFPDIWDSTLSEIAAHLAATAEAGPALVNVLGDRLAGLGDLYQGLSLQTETLDRIAERMALAPLVEAVAEGLVPPLVESAGQLECVCESLQPVHTDLVGLATEVHDFSDAMAQMLYRLVHELKDKVVEVNVDATFDLSEAVAALLAGLANMAPDLLPPAPVAGVSKPGSVFGQGVQATVNAVRGIFGGGLPGELTIPGLVDLALGGAESGAEAFAGRYASTVAGLVAKCGATGNPSVGGIFEPVLSLVESAWQSLTEDGVATPATAWRRGVAAYAGAVGIGLATSAIAGLAEADVLGCGDFNFGYVTSVMGKAAGFDPIVNAFLQPLYRAYLNEPMRYETNRLARPFIPGVGDLLRFQYKRIFSRKPGDPETAEPPFTFPECMAYAGYSDDWIGVYEDDLYREPMARDLLLMAEVGEFNEDWWTYKVRRLGYSDADAPVMVEAFKRRASRTQLLDLYRRLWYLCAEGFMTEDEFRRRCKATKLPELAIEYGAQAAAAELERTERRELLEWAEAQYDRDVLDDEGLRDALAEVYDDPDMVDRRFRLCQVKRFRRIYRVTPTDEARKSLSLYRAAFLDGVATEHEYRAQLTEVGLEGRVIELRMALDVAKRDGRMLARFRQYELPALRDQVMHGMLDVAAYVARLRKAGFPPEHLAAERELVMAQVARRTAGLLRSEALPAYRQAYVVGLVSRTYLAAALRDAGLTPEGMDAELTVLDYRREQAGQRRAETEARKRERLLADERRDAERTRKEAERQAQARKRAADERRREAERYAAALAKAAAAEAKAAAEARRPGWPADVARVQKQIAATYKAQGQMLPEDVWSLGCDLEIELARLPGPDPIRVDELAGRIEQALARYAGVLPA